MTISNDFVPFCNDTANVESLGSYDTLAPAGNQTGIASSSFVNRALRQGTTIAALVAQFMMNQTQTSINDNYDESDTSISAQLYAQFVAATTNLPLVFSNLLSGSSATYAPPIYFFCSTFTTPPSAGATYTNNAVTFTVISSTTINGVPVTLMQATASFGAPTTSGTLTKTSGTGDATLTFYAFRSPLFLDIELKGGGGGGGGATSGSTSDNSVGGGGGEGAVASFSIINPSLSGYTYSVGVGGVANAGASGGAGGTTTFNSIAAGGGGGGLTNSITLTTAQTVTSCALCGTGGTATASATVRAVGGSVGGPGSSCTTIVVSGGVGGGQGGKLGGIVNTSGVANGTAAEANSGAGGSGGAICAASSSSVIGGVGAAGYIAAKANF